MERGASPFDTIVDAPFTVTSGGQAYSPHNYDEKFEGTITLRRALAGSRNVPAVKLAERVGISSVVDMARRFGITTPLPPYLPLALGAADMKLIEHVSAFTVYANEGIRIDPHMIRRVTSYDGALLEEAHPEVHDVLAPDVAHTMTAMLEDVVQFGTAIKAKTLGRPAGGKTGTTQDFTDAWFIGFTPQITAGVWVGFDDKQISLGKRFPSGCSLWNKAWQECQPRISPTSSLSRSKLPNITFTPTSPIPRRKTKPRLPERLQRLLRPNRPLQALLNAERQWIWLFMASVAAAF
jgi:penicillin-binding protein 1A